jgi:hypothetical protein
MPIPSAADGRNLTRMAAELLPNEAASQARRRAKTVSMVSAAIAHLSGR